MNLSSAPLRLPFPIAASYADLDAPAASPQLRQDALYFTAYQLMRTVALTLVGQYFTRELPPAAPLAAAESLNMAIGRVRSPYFSDWIGLLRALHRHGPALGLDFFPEFPAAMQRLRAPENLVAIPPDYGLNAGANATGLTWLDALLALRNHCAHSGSARDEVCRHDLRHFRPILDALVANFAWLGDYELLALEGSLDAEPVRLAILRGLAPESRAWDPLPDDLRAALENSPVVMRALRGALQPLFPLFHGHIAGEPVHLYDGHYLLDGREITRRTIYYLGCAGRTPLDDADPAATRQLQPGAPPAAADLLARMLARRRIPWRVRREDLAPWTIRDSVCDYARRTLEALNQQKCPPHCYLDRPALSGPLRRVATDPGAPQRAFLLTGRAGTGKTALLCDLVRHLLEPDAGDTRSAAERAQHLVFFLRGDAISANLGGKNRLLADFVHKIGLEPGDIPSFGSFFATLEVRRREDQVSDRLFIIVLDALNEAREPRQVFDEALELVAVARDYPWVRVILSIREEFLPVWRAPDAESSANPFSALAGCFVPPPEDPTRPRRPEDPPAWHVPELADAEAAQVYARYQERQRAVPGQRACRTPWMEIPPATRGGLLRRPLYLDLWMTAFNGREAPPVSGPAELFGCFLDRQRGDFDLLWPSLQAIVDHLLPRGRCEVTDADDAELRAVSLGRYAAHERRQHFSPVEVGCAAGILLRRAREDGSGSVFTHQSLAEQVILARLRELGPGFPPEKVAAWLRWPPTPELEGSLAYVAEELWTLDRSGELAAWAGPAQPFGRALTRAISARLERHETLQLEARLYALATALTTHPASAHWFAEQIIYDVRNAVEGWARTEPLRILYKQARQLLERLAEADPNNASVLFHFGISHERLGDALRQQGNLAASRDCFEHRHEIIRRLRALDPSSTRWQRDLSVSFVKIGDVLRDQGDLPAAMKAFRDSFAIAQRLAEVDPANAVWQRDLFLSLERIGRVLSDQGDLSTALKTLRDSFAIQKRLVEVDPTNAGWQRDLSYNHQSIGDVLRTQGDLPAALQAFRDSHSIFERLAKADPANAGWQYALGGGHNRIGCVLLDQGDLAGALAAFGHHQEIISRLANADSANALWQRDLALSQETIGDVLLVQGDLPAALQAFRDSHSIFERLAKADPTNSVWQRDVWWSCGRMATIAEQTGGTDALDWWRQAFEKLSEIKQRGNMLPTDGHYLAQFRQKIGL